MTLILHIGGPKTGSVAVQKALCHGRKLLRRYNISLASNKQRLSNGRQVDLSFHSLYHAVYRGGRPRGDHSRFASDGDADVFRREQAVAFRSFLEARAERSRHVVVSDESLSHLDSDTVSRLADFLASAGHRDVRVILYVREPASLFLSLAQHRLKVDGRLADPYTWHYPYLLYLEPWEREFPGRLEVRSFDRSALVGGSVVTDFAAFVADVLGLKREALAALECGEETRQPLPAEAMDLLWRYQQLFHAGDAGRFTRDGRHLLAVSLAVGERLGLEPPRLRQSIRDLIVARHRADLRGLRERYGIRFAAVPDALVDQVADPPVSSAQGEMGPMPHTPAALRVDDLIENLHQESAELFRLHCLAELCSRVTLDGKAVR